MLKVHNWKDSIPFVAPEKSEPALDCDEAVVKCLHLDPGQESRPHIHRTAVDVMVIVGGRGLATVDGQPRPVEVGDVILNPSGTVHGIRNDGPGRLTWLVIQAPPPNRKTAAAPPAAATADA
ncbi:MAG: cupin domain-containing protein [Hyphomicrobiales bacterium]|nr:cupin domain-containing protein [Hyphomicrobiales bacterium]